MKDLSGCLGLLLVGVGIVVGAALVFALITEWAWNGTMPVIFGLPTITFWQGFQLNLLSGILLKSTQNNTNKCEK